MRAARCEEYGGPENVVIRDIPSPEVTPGHVLVDVAAAAVNFPDLLFIANRYQVPASLPFTPGSEFAGRVAAVGEGVTGLAPGDLVYGSVFTGAMAEQVLVPARAVAPIPSNRSISGDKWLRCIITLDPMSEMMREAWSVIGLRSAS
jgi:NADPH2:quinone reductase